MFTTRSSKNRIIERDLSIRYEVERVDYTNSQGVAASWYKVTRRADKRYHYEDMTQITAMNIAADLVALYTRQCAILLRHYNTQTVPPVQLVGMCQSKIQPTRRTGNIWGIDVTVDETDVRASATNPADPASLFAAENARDYDDENMSSIEVAKAVYYHTANFEGVVILTSDFVTDTSSVVVQFKSPIASDWTSSSHVGGTLRWINSRTLVYGLTNSFSTGHLIRLKSGSSASNEVTISTDFDFTVSSVTIDGNNAGEIVCTGVPPSVSLPTAFLCVAGTNITAYSGLTTGMTWNGSTCTIGANAPVISFMRNTDGVLFVQGTQISNLRAIEYPVSPQITINMLRDIIGPPTYACYFVATPNSAARSAFLTETSFTLKGSSNGSVFVDCPVSGTWTDATDGFTLYIENETVYNFIQSYPYFKILIGGILSDVYHYVV